MQHGAGARVAIARIYRDSRHRRRRHRGGKDAAVNRHVGRGGERGWRALRRQGERGRESERDSHRKKGKGGGGDSVTFYLADHSGFQWSGSDSARDVLAAARALRASAQRISSECLYLGRQLCEAGT